MDCKRKIDNSIYVSVSEVRLDWLAFLALRRTVTGIVYQRIIYAIEETKKQLICQNLVKTARIFKTYAWDATEGVI